MKKLIVFDLDGTLAPSKSSLAPQTAGLLRDLLCIIKVAVISGGAWTQFEKQLLTDLPRNSFLANLSCFQPVERNSFNTTASGRSFIQRISRRSKKRRLSTLSTRRRKRRAITPRRYGEM
jgi:phosphoglycolate phosphatase-like HAD superfamily hydrolase